MIELAARERTLPALLSRAGEGGAAQARRPLVTIGDAAWHRADAATLAASRAATLRAAGIGRGDRVALMCPNRIEFIETFVACGWLGAITVPINVASMAPQIEYLLADSGARLLVIDASLVERLADVAPTRTSVEAVWVVGASAEGGPSAGWALEAWPQAGAPIAPEPVAPGDVLAILYTSGTTGPSKGVLCPHAQYYWWGRQSTRILGLRSDDVLCTTLPLFHINALNTLSQALVSGAPVVYERRFSASGFWPAMERHGATVVYLLGAMVPILLAQPAADVERRHRVRVGLGPGVPAAAAAAFSARTGIALVEGYGSTETNFVIATPANGDGRGTMGWVQPGFDARVVDEDDNALPDGTAGELVLRADEPFAFALGYHGMPEKTVAACRNLWFHTGDRVVREADGALRFVDRIKDAIRRRGENISSYEVEQVLLVHPSVAEAAVFPVRSDLAEDEVMAAVVARPGALLDVGDLWRHCEPRLPAFAIPRFIEVVGDLPRTENGKVRKFQLRERGVTAATHDRARS